MTKREIMNKYGIKRFIPDTDIDKELTEEEASKFDSFCMLVTSMASEAST